MKILMVLTSHDKMGDTGHPTGIWLEEFTTPYYQFIDAGVQVTIATPKGGPAPIDPTSLDDESESTKRYQAESKEQDLLAFTKTLAEVAEQDFDAIFYPGGHGPLWDLAEEKTSADLIAQYLKAGKPVAAVCHGPAVFKLAQIDGKPVVKGKRVTGFSNSEEEAAGLTDVVPFLVEDMLKENGGIYECGEDWQPHVITDGLL
ncbi:MAG: type 1 glutamine amidotransferase domain-containing protein, partial [Vibrio sp.]